jgi:hypothetical protein
MAKLVVCAATAYAGVRHRYLMLRQVKAFADRNGYAVQMLWGVTNAVSNYRHENLFAPVPGVEIRNISEEELKAIRYFCQKDGEFTYKGEALRMLRAGETPGERFFSWDLAGSGALANLVPRPFPQLIARPCGALQTKVEDYIRANSIQNRLGIRVRAMELPNQKNRVHRIKSELDAVLYSLYRIPWHVPVFIATDSEYVQKTLVAHFADARFLPKQFNQEEATGRYVHRNDQNAMKTFVEEVGCLCACRMIISFGGFLNDSAVQSKIIKEPYSEAAFIGVKRV